MIVDRYFTIPDETLDTPQALAVRIDEDADPPFPDAVEVSEGGYRAALAAWTAASRSAWNALEDDAATAAAADRVVKRDAIEASMSDVHFYSGDARSVADAIMAAIFGDNWEGA